MNLALIGYGKMGKIIEEMAISRGHNIVGKCTSTKPIEELDFSKIDVAIEFTAPHFAVGHIEHCVRNNTPVVVGTTAWNEQLDYVKQFVAEHEGGLLYASNFSIGVNVFFEINRKLAKLMTPNTKYQASVNEIHHTEKIDAPSGTAVSLANDMLRENENLTSWIHYENEPPQEKSGQIAVTSRREKGVPGTHNIKYTSDIDTIELIHTAHNRQGFALGAIIAAEWIIGKKGVYTMQDVINS